ncbi:ankyrin repeat-containing domain protein [Aspergillus unguis]
MGMASELAFSDDLETRLDALVEPDVLEDKLRTRCGLFVTIRDGLVHLFHQTAREFLVQEDVEKSPHPKFCFTMADAQSTWARVCIRYLMLDKDDTQWEKSCRTNHLQEYASENWFKHLQRAPLASRVELKDSVYSLYAERFEEWCGSFWTTVVPFIHRPDPYYPIHAAAFNGHTDVVRSLIQTGKGSVHSADYNGTTALIWSSWTGQCEISELLLSHGADVNAVSNLYGPPLLVAALKGHLNIVALLLEKGADMNHQSGPTNRVQAHLTLNPDLVYLSDYTGTALWAAALKGHIEIVRLLLKKQSTGLDFALLSASRGGHLDIIRLLIEHKANANVRDEDSFYVTAIQAASQGGHLDVLLYLFEQGAEDEPGCGHFDSALEAAAYYGHGRLIKTLLEHGRYGNDEYWAALESACQQKDLQAVSDLAPLVTDVNALSRSLPHGILELAFTESSPQIIQVLVENGADVQKNNPLATAAQLGYLEIVETLVEKGADLNKGSPLAKAASSGHIEVVKILLEKGADVAEGSPLAIAAQHGHLDTIELLLDHGADIDRGCPLTEAASSGHAHVVEFLVDEEADPDEDVRSILLRTGDITG